jgi:hypothetical protein
MPDVRHYRPTFSMPFLDLERLELTTLLLFSIGGPAILRNAVRRETET